MRLENCAKHTTLSLIITQKFASVYAVDMFSNLFCVECLVLILHHFMDIGALCQVNFPF